MYVTIRFRDEVFRMLMWDWLNEDRGLRDQFLAVNAGLVDLGVV